MPRVSATLLALAALLALPAPASAQSQLEREGVREIIVKRQAGADPQDVREEADVTHVRSLRLTRTELVRAPAGQLDEALAELNASPDVVYAEPNAPVQALTSDTWYSLLWGLENTGQLVNGSSGTADADIDAPAAWTYSTGAGEVVGVVDTGILPGHEDLASRLATNPGESGGGKESNGVDDDHNGLVDDWRGWDFVDCRTYFCDADNDHIADNAESDAVIGPDNTPNDGHGHGTHVSGTIAAAAGNGAGIAGVAYDARIMPIRALDTGGTGTLAATASAFDYAGDLGLKVVNASLGSTYASQAEYAAIAAHPGTLYVFAAGNSSVDADTSPAYPCKHNLANIICVGATTPIDTRAWFSNYGATTVDVFAPGVNILSAYRDGGYVFMNGTSMAAPHVAGVAALVRAAKPGLTTPALKALLMSTVDTKPALAGLAVTGGRVNAASAVEAALATEVDPDSDGDGVPDSQDNCPQWPNPGQSDLDGDGTGDPCDPTPYPDADGDGVRDTRDNCPYTLNPGQADVDGDGIGDACDATDDRPAPPVDPVAPVDPGPDDETVDDPPPPAPPALTGLKLTGRALRAAPRRPRGARELTIGVAFTVDRAADVTLTVQRKVCVRSRCSFKTAATVALSGRPGRNAYTLRRKVGGRSLAAGSYQLVVKAGDSRTLTASFAVKP